MATKNRRVAAYLPPEVDKAFVDFKIKHGLATEESPNQNDSQALVQLLSELLGVAHQVEHSVSRQLDIGMAIQLQDLKAELVSQISELSSELLALRQKVDALTADQSLGSTLTTAEELADTLPATEGLADTPLTAEDLTDTLSNREMAKRIGINASTLSNWKKNKTPEQMKEDIAAKDPDGITWVYFPELQQFKKEGDTPGGLQSELFSGNATSPTQVHPLPEGSERSGEG